MSSPSSSYDVVCIGTQLAPLLAGTLLAKRGFRVLMVGQDELPPAYEPIAGLSLPREPFTFLPDASPIAARVMSELSIQQVFRQHSQHLDPAFQLCLPGCRFELSAERETLEKEIERVFPEAKRAIWSFLDQTEHNDGLLDQLFEGDLAWPPESFLEKRRFSRALREQPFDRDGQGLDPLAGLPPGHPFRLAAQLPTRFSDRMDPRHQSGLRLTRFFHAWRRGRSVVEGYGALREMLVERIRTHGGEVREGEKIDSLTLSRGAVKSVTLAASAEEVGASAVLVGSPLSALLRLVPDRTDFEGLFERIGEPVVRYYRYTLNLVLAAEGVPPGMGHNIFFVRDPGLDLAETNALHLQLGSPREDGSRVLCVQALLPRRGVEDIPDYLRTLRERIQSSLTDLLPFLSRHLLWIDSPHDGRDLYDCRAGQYIKCPNAWSRGSHAMRRVYGFPVHSGMGLCALPVRSPIKKLFFCNSQVVPGLGMEGSFLAAWSASGLVSKLDGKKEWMRRGRFGKIEL